MNLNNSFLCNFYVKTIIVALAFLVPILVPSLTMIIFRQPSYATGMLLTSILIILYAQVLKSAKVITKFYGLPYMFKFVVVVSVFLFFHTTLAFSITTVHDFSRLLQSIILFFIILFAAYCLVSILESIGLRAAYQGLVIVLVLFVFIMLFSGIMGYAPVSYKHLNRPVFPFMEPSHFSLIAAPFYLWLVKIKKKYSNKILAILCAVLLLAFMSNLTFVCLILLGLYLNFGFKRFLFLIPIGILLITYYNYDVTYYVSRVDFSNSDKNISTLVWLQGWEESIINWKQTFGVGVGFQQLGVRDLQGRSAQILFQLFQNNYMNRYDGGTLGAKVVGEFGLLGVCMTGILGYHSFKSISYLRSNRTRVYNNPRLIFYHCCICYFILELAVRSMSYISPSFFMYMVGSIGLKIHTIKIRKHKKYFLKSKGTYFIRRQYWHKI